MRIATFNLENLGGRRDDADGLAERIDILRPQLARLDADILCLQEVNAQSAGSGHARRLSALDRLLEGSPYEGYERAVTHHPATGRLADHHNLAILSRWPVEAHGQCYHDLVPAPIHAFLTADPPAPGARSLKWDRPFQHARIRLPDGTPLELLNVHLRAPVAAPVPGRKLNAWAWKSASAWAEGYYMAAVKRAGQALELRMFVDGLFDADPHALVLAAGDFNVEEREVAGRLIAAELEDTSNGRLADRVMVPLEHSLPESRRYTVIHRGRKVMLDHMFASRALLSLYQELEIHNEALGDELVAYAAVEDSPESYHAPVVACFRS